MALELVYTSAVRGVKPGTHGFCTVACSRTLPAPLAATLESLSGYRHLYPPESENARFNPIVRSHLTFLFSGRPLHLLSRIADAGLDYSKRTNKLAHHLALGGGELISAGPAELFAQPGLFAESWTGEPVTYPTERTIPKLEKAAEVCRSWEQTTGDAGWGGVLAASAISGRSAGLVLPPHFDPFPLLREAIALIPPADRWRVTFSTFFTKLPPGIDCLWRCVALDAPEEALVRAVPKTLLIDLTRPLGSPDRFATDPTARTLIETARKGPSAAPVRQAVPVVSVASVPVAPQNDSIELEDDALFYSETDSTSAPPLFRGSNPPATRPLPPSVRTQFASPPPKKSRFFSCCLFSAIALVILGCLGGLGVYFLGGNLFKYIDEVKDLSKPETQIEAEKSAGKAPSSNQAGQGPKEEEKKSDANKSTQPPTPPSEEKSGAPDQSQEEKPEDKASSVTEQTKESNGITKDETETMPEENPSDSVSESASPNEPAPEDSSAPSGEPAPNAESVSPKETAPADAPASAGESVPVETTAQDKELTQPVQSETVKKNDQNDSVEIALEFLKVVEGFHMQPRTGDAAWNDETTDKRAAHVEYHPKGFDVIYNKLNTLLMNNECQLQIETDRFVPIGELDSNNQKAVFKLTADGWRYDFNCTHYNDKNEKQIDAYFTIIISEKGIDGYKNYDNAEKFDVKLGNMFLLTCLTWSFKASANNFEDMFDNTKEHNPIKTTVMLPDFTGYFTVPKPIFFSKNVLDSPTINILNLYSELNNLESTPKNQNNTLRSLLMIEYDKPRRDDIENWQVDPANGNLSFDIDEYTFKVFFKSNDKNYFIEKQCWWNEKVEQKPEPKQDNNGSQNKNADQTKEKSEEEKPKIIIRPKQLTNKNIDDGHKEKIKNIFKDKPYKLSIGYKIYCRHPNHPDDTTFNLLLIDVPGEKTEENAAGEASE